MLPYKYSHFFTLSPNGKNSKLNLPEKVLDDMMMMTLYGKCPFCIVSASLITMLFRMCRKGWIFRKI